MDKQVLGVTIAMFVALVALCLLPIWRDSPEDQGDGKTYVVIPGYVKTPPLRPRTWTFLALAGGLGLLYALSPEPALLYQGAVRAVATAITHNEATVNGYVVRVRIIMIMFAVGWMLGLSVVIRAGLARRLAVAGHAVLYVVMSVLLQAMMIVAGMGTGWAVSPFGIEATLANVFVGGLVVTRLVFTTFVLPRGVTVPLRRPKWRWDTILTLCAIVSMVALLVVGYALLSESANLTSEWQVVLPLYAMTFLFMLMCLPLLVLWRISRKLPKPGPDKPPVDVIVPAYNEEENIARLLRSIDVAAGRYGGPVRVIISNDGSTDDTVRISAEEIANFRYARGEILSGPNGRQAVALNRGIAIAETEIILRIDADCVMGPDAIKYSVPWFRDPVIGSVGAMEEPRRDTVTWFHRLRTLECLSQFRFARVAQSLVDGVVCIPGTFTAFRRTPAVECGGFPTGMNGEDGDLTMNIGRLGYRVVIDPRIRSFEDVPRSPGEFLEQRTRWARAGIHVSARHIPFRAGWAGPRVWFWTMHKSVSWFTMQVNMVAPIYMIEMVLAHPSFRRNLVTLVVLFMLGGGMSLMVAIPLAVKHRLWYSILWIPTWFAYGYLKRMAVLEAVITLPTRPVLSRPGATEVPIPVRGHETVPASGETLGY